MPVKSAGKRAAPASQRPGAKARGRRREPGVTAGETAQNVSRETFPPATVEFSATDIRDMLKAGEIAPGDMFVRLQWYEFVFEMGRNLAEAANRLLEEIKENEQKKGPRGLRRGGPVRH